MTAPVVSLAWFGNAAASASRVHDLAAPVLLLLLGVALGMCLAGLMVVMHYMRADNNQIRRGVRFTERYPRSRKFTGGTDRKSTRLNSSHSQISYAVFCLKKKNKKTRENKRYRTT